MKGTTIQGSFQAGYYTLGIKSMICANDWVGKWGFFSKKVLLRLLQHSETHLCESCDYTMM